MKSGCNVWVDFVGSHTLKARWRDALMSLQVTKLAKKKSCTVPEGPLSREYIIGGAQLTLAFVFVCDGGSLPGQRVARNAPP